MDPDEFSDTIEHEEKRSNSVVKKVWASTPKEETQLRKDKEFLKGLGRGILGAARAGGRYAVEGGRTAVRYAPQAGRAVGRFATGFKSRRELRKAADRPFRTAGIRFGVRKRRARRYQPRQDEGPSFGFGGDMPSIAQLAYGKRKKGNGGLPRITQLAMRW